MKGRSSNWKDVDDSSCASVILHGVARLTQAGSVMSACKCSLFGRDQKPHDPRDWLAAEAEDVEQSQVGALAILCELAADLAHFLDFVFCFSCNQQG